MSTKIYNAFKYKGKLSELIISLKEIKEKYINDKIEELSKFSNMVITKKDINLVEEDIKIKDLYKKPLGDLIFSEFLEKQIKMGYNTPLNIDSSCVIYAHKNDIYIQFFGLNSNYYKNILDKLEDFHYQNQSDISNYDWKKEKWEEMTPQRKSQLTRNWNKREKVWGEIIKNYDTFGESGLIFNFNPTSYKLLLFCQKIIKNFDT